MAVASSPELWMSRWSMTFGSMPKWTSHLSG